MEKDKIINQFSEFLMDNYQKDLGLLVSEGGKSLQIDFSLLDKFSPNLTDDILDKPEETIKILEEAVKEIDLSKGMDIHIRLFNIPDSNRIRIRNIRSEHIGKLLCVDGIVKRASEVRPEIAETVFECPECGNRMMIIQTEKDKTIKFPGKCDCGNRRGFKLVNQKLYDARWVAIEEPFEITTGERPSEIMVYLKEDLTSPKIRNKTEPGNRIKITGILKEVPRRTTRGVKTRQMDILLDANNVEAMETEWEELIISPDDEKKIKKFAKDPKIYDKLIGSLAPTMYGLDKVKLAIILQLFGGVPHLLEDRTRIRGDIHILLIGDPAVGKCVHGDTYVTLQDGSIRKIMDIVEEGLNNSDINTMDDGYFTFTNHDTFSMDFNSQIIPSKATVLWKRESTDYLYEIKTETGTKIKVTPSHIFFSLFSGQIIPKKAGNLTTNDFIASARILPVDGIREKINIKVNRRPRSKHIILPTKITPELCRFIGYIISEGYIQDRASSPVVWFTNNDTDLLNDFKYCTKRVFGDITLTERKPHIGKDAIDSYICSVELVDFLKQLCPSLLKSSEDKKIPPIILQVSNKNLTHLLRAIFDGEATIRKKAQEVCITTASEELAHQIRLILLRFGIISQLHPRTAKATNSDMEKKTYYRVRISGENFEKYMKQIGFTSRVKQRKAEKNLKKKLHTNIDTIPNVATALKTIRESLKMTQFDVDIPRSTYQHSERGSRAPKGQTLRKIIEAFNGRLQELEKSLDEIDSITQSKLKSTREKIHISQAALAKESKVSQTLISTYELGKIKLNNLRSERTFQKIKNSLKQICRRMLSNRVKKEIKNLEMLINSDIFWDKIIEVKKVKSDSDYVYDLQVDPCHNFIADNLIVHNSQLLKLASDMIPRGKYVSGKGVTGAGLTAAVVKDEQFMGGWVLEAGALVLANRSLIGIDEFEKMDKGDQIAMHEAMSLQSVSIAKASIVATLPAKTAVLAGSNPKLGRFDPYIPIREQVDITETLLSRFDVKFALRDIPSSEVDEKMIDHILKARHFEPEKTKPSIPPEFLRKYIAYTKANCQPVLTKEAGKKMKDFYVDLRSKTTGEEAPIPITLRQYESLIRLAESSAKVQLSNKVRIADADRAIDIMKYSIRQFGFEPETGLIDIDRAEGVTTSAQRSKIRIILDIIEELEKAIGKSIPMSEILKRGKEQNIDNTDDILRKMLNEGIVFSPRPNFIEKV